MKRALAILATVLLALCGPLGVFAWADQRLMPVPTRNLYPGEIIQPDIFQTKLFNVNSVAMQNYAMDSGQIAGMEVYRTLLAGKPVALASVKTADLVKRNKQAQARFVSDGIVIEGSLVALQDAVAGEVIDAKNPTSGIVVRALVNSDGSLTVSAP